jgi:predicted cupin superfamily sugar epimerase
MGDGFRDEASDDSSEDSTQNGHYGKSAKSPCKYHLFLTTHDHYHRQKECFIVYFHNQDELNAVKNDVQ